MPALHEIRQTRDTAPPTATGRPRRPAGRPAHPDHTDYTEV